MKKRAVGYCRISTLMQVDNTSLKDQEDKIKMYAKLHDIVIDEIFIDKAISGKSTDRPKYHEMIECVKQNDIDMIIVYKNDRIHRSLYNLLAMIYELKEYEVALVSVTEMFDTSTPQGMLFLQMLGSFAEFERAVINERTRNGRIARLNEKRWVGGKPALGYKVNKEGKFEIDEEESKIVKDIFRLRSKGISLARIGSKYGFSKQKVDYILKNKNYIGVFEYHGKKEKNDITLEIEPIVSRYMWNKVNNKKYNGD
ncbi:recombinase family protein [Faecalimicrobium sp. JNUCC 81]